MASPQKENGYTAIANELLDVLCQLHLSGNEWSYILAVLRKTYGFQKKEDWISNSQIVQMTGMRKERVSEAKRSLISKGIVTENRNKISLQKDHEKWAELRKTVTFVTENRNKSYGKPYTQKKKETITKEISKTDVLQLNKKDMSWKKPYNENAHSDDEVVIDADSGEEIKPKEKPKKHYKEVYAIFSTILGKNTPANWLVNKTQMACAENLYTERGIEQITKALQSYKDAKENLSDDVLEFLPQITSPYDLDSKWTKLNQFVKKHG